MTNTTRGAIAGVRNQPNAPHPTVRKVVLAGCVGIFVELYDNGIFAFMATALAIVFFDVSKSSDALMLVFAGYAISFFIRPLGAVVCGILGDRIGRQKVLVGVIALISAATAGIGLLPSYAAIGIAAPILLVLLRVAQGFSVGGEAAGAMTFLAEHAPAGKRGLITSYAQIASFLALLTGTLVAFSMSPWLDRGRDRRRRIRQLGVARSVPGGDPDGCDRLVHPSRHQ